MTWRAIFGCLYAVGLVSVLALHPLDVIKTRLQGAPASVNETVNRMRPNQSHRNPYPSTGPCEPLAPPSPSQSHPLASPAPSPTRSPSLVSSPSPSNPSRPLTFTPPSPSCPLASPPPPPPAHAPPCLAPRSHNPPPRPPPPPHPRRPAVQDHVDARRATYRGTVHAFRTVLHNEGVRGTALPMLFLQAGT